MVNKLMRFPRRVAKAALYYLRNPAAIGGEDERVAATVDGVNLWCLRENIIERCIIESKVWEPDETRIVRELVRPGQVVFDIGANIGYFSLLMCKLVGPHGQVHSFEPTAYAVTRLKRNIGLNPSLPTDNIVINQRGLLAQSVRKTEAIEARFSARVLAYSEPEDLEFTTLDEYCNDVSLTRLDFVKIDVDGYDLEVARGGTEALGKFRPLVLAEFCDRVLERKGTSVEEYGRMFLNLGYDNCRLATSGEEGKFAGILGDGRLRSGSWNILLFPS